MTLPLISRPTSTACMGRFENASQLDIFQVLDHEGTVQTHMNADGTIDPPLYPQISYTTITTAQLLTIDTVPVNLVGVPHAALFPTAQLVTIPQYVSLIYNFVTTPFTGSGTFAIGWGTTTAQINATFVASFSSTGFTDQSSSQIVLATSSFATALPLSSILGKPVAIYLDSGTLTLGDGNLVVDMSYTTVRVS